MSDVQTVTLEDGKSGATAKVLVGFGFNCYSYRPVVDGEPWELLWSATNFASGTERPSHSGIPILFPYAGRLKGQTLQFEGRSYPLEGNDGRGNAIHGYVLNRPWRIVERSEGRLVGELHAAADAPQVLEKWPSDFRLRVDYALEGGALTCEIIVDNPGSGRLPFGLGLHPYFRLPLGPGGTADDCRVTVPVSQYWELVEMLPSGRRLAAEGSRGLAVGMSFAQTQLDDVFTEVAFDNHWARATIADQRSGRVVSYEFDDGFTQCVVYNPPHREAICIEPYTCVPDAYRLGQQAAETGLRVLGAGETARFRTRLALSA